MADLTAAKLLKYGCVCFIPTANFDAVYQSGLWQGQTILLLEASDVLPGFYGYFTIAGMPNLTEGSTNPGVGFNNADADDI